MSVTVRELIEKLQQFDPDVQVLVAGEEYGFYDPNPQVTGEHSEALEETGGKNAVIING